LHHDRTVDSQDRGIGGWDHASASTRLFDSEIGDAQGTLADETGGSRSAEFQIAQAPVGRGPAGKTEVLLHHDLGPGIVKPGQRAAHKVQIIIHIERGIAGSEIDGSIAGQVIRHFQTAGGNGELGPGPKFQAFACLTGNVD